MDQLVGRDRRARREQVGAPGGHKCTSLVGRALPQCQNILGRWDNLASSAVPIPVIRANFGKNINLDSCEFPVTLHFRFN
jgi:hypothetical protein